MSVAAAQTPMKADEFLLWAEQRPEGERWELVAGKPVAMAPERSRHALVKAEVWRALREAIRASDLPCTAYPDGMAVTIDERTVYEPDALLRCGEPLADDAITVTDPLVIVEVSSPSSKTRDAGVKLADYVRLPTLRHYLLVDATLRALVHHRIEADGRIDSRVLRAGTLILDPPGLSIALEDLFG